MKFTMQRRWAAAITALLVATSVVSFATPASALVPADYDGVRTKYAEWLNGGPSYSTTDPVLVPKITAINTTASTLWSTMNLSPTRTYLWSDKVFSPSTPATSEALQTTAERLRDMSLALKTRGTALYGSATLKTDIIAGLNWFNTNWYNASTSQIGNWYNYQIGVPLALVDATVLLYADLTPTQISNYMSAIETFKPTVTGVGANRVWETKIVLLRGVIVQDNAKITAATSIISSTLVERTAINTDGFYSDGSYIEHQYYAYSGGYGLAAYDAMTAFLYWLKGSPWEFVDPNSANLVKWAFSAYVPLIYRSSISYGVLGRLAAWKDNRDNAAGIGAVESILRAVDLATPTEQATLKSLIKEWILSDNPSSDFFAKASLFSSVRASAIVNDPSIVRSGGQSTYRQYEVMDRPMAVRPGYLFGVSVTSSRTRNYELVNSEGHKGWFYAAGMTTLYVGSDLSQYGDNYWPTINASRMPGTTVLSNTSTTEASAGASSWVGGVSLLGRYGTTGMNYTQQGRNLSALKSWFIFDNEIVALGAGISSTDGIETETIIDNRKLNSSGSNAFTVNGTAKSSTLGWSETMTGVNWVNLEGNTADGGIGYYFPTAVTLKGLRENRTGSWGDLNKNPADLTVQSNKFLTQWISHGTNPTNQKYAYVILPGKDATGTAAYASAPKVFVLANDTDVQAVKNNPLNIIGANFWTDGYHAVTVSASYTNFLSSDRKASVMFQELAGKVSLAVSDPTQASTTPIHIEIKRPATGVVSADAGVTVTQLSPTIKVTIDPTSARGKTFNLVLSY